MGQSQGCLPVADTRPGSALQKGSGSQSESRTRAARSSRWEQHSGSGAEPRRPRLLLGRSACLAPGHDRLRAAVLYGTSTGCAALYLRIDYGPAARSSEHLFLSARDTRTRTWTGGSVGNEGKGESYRGVGFPVRKGLARLGSVSLHSPPPKEGDL